VSNPNDRANGGTFTFAFDKPVNLESMTFLDTESAPKITLTFEDGSTEVLFGPELADGAQALFTFNKEKVTQMKIRLKESGAVDNIKYNTCEGGGNGDPHIKPWDGERYYFMGECDSVLHTSEVMDVHIRTTIRDFYSFIESAAVRVGDSILEMSMGNTHQFFINGAEFSDSDLPLRIEGDYTLRKISDIRNDAGTKYALSLEHMTVELSVLKFMMSVDLKGADPSFDKGTAGLMGQFPNGELIGRDGVTQLKHDGVAKTITGRMEPLSNSMGQEWQVRDTDPQLFREIREPAWPRQCEFPKAEASAVRRRLTTSIDMDAASEACAQVHSKDSADFDFCVMDVVMMDDVNAAYAW